jgi:uncharacterized membrane protein YqjE
MTAVTSSQPPQVPAIPLSPERPVSPQDQSIGALVREASTHLSTLIRSEVELARAEVTSEVRKGVKGSVYFLVALSIVLFSLFFLFFTFAEVLDLWLPRWAAFAIVFLVMLIAAAVFGLLGYLRVRSIRKPERTISTLQEAVQVVLPDEDARASDGRAPGGAPNGRGGQGTVRSGT